MAAHRESLPDRIRRAFRLDAGQSRSRESELDDEIRFHLDQRIEELVAHGWTRDDAEREALARFGPYEESRNQLLATARERDEVLTMFARFDAIRSDTRYALRQILRSPGFSIAITLTFALGIGANATMFAVIDRLLLRPPAFVVHPQDIMRLAAGTKGHAFTQQTLNYPVFRAIRDHAAGLADVTATYDATVPIGRGQAAQQAAGLLVTGNYFSLLGAKPQIGRVFQAADDVEPLGSPVAVLSYDYWQSHFGGSDAVLGRTLDAAGRRFTVIGVMPRNFTGLDLDGPDMWLPMSAGAAQLGGGSSWSTNSSGSWLRVYARLQPNVPAERAASDAMRVAREAAVSAWFTGKDWSFGALPIMELRGSSQGVTSSVTRVLAAMSLIVLLVACANVANLLLARGLRRREEIAVRLALGVSRGRLLIHLVTESALLAMMGGVVALLVAYLGGGAVFKLLFSDVNLHSPAIDGRVLAFTAIVTLLTGLFTGLLPALQVSRLDLAGVLKTGGRQSGHRSRTRTALLVAQAAMSVVLLFGAGLFERSLTKLSDMRLGVDVDRVALAKMSLRSIGRPASDADRIFSQALDRVRAIPGVSHAAVAATAPFGASFGVGIVIPGRDSSIHADAMYNIVTADYFRTLGSRILRGRDFTDADRESSPRVMIVNQMWATHYLHDANPLGVCARILSDSLPCAEVVGVVENVRRQSIFEDSSDFVYLPLAQAKQALGNRELLVRIDNGRPAAALESVRLALQTAAPGLPFADVHLFASDQTVTREFRPFRLGAAMFGAFGVLALALAAIGIYGVISYNVGQRTREMGVRIALGAQRGSVARLVMRQGVFVTGIGVVIGAAVGLVGSRLVQHLLYEESARDPGVLILVAAVLLATGAIASLVPAWRAVNTDPVTALRAE